MKTYVHDKSLSIFLTLVTQNVHNGSTLLLYFGIIS